MDNIYDVVILGAGPAGMTAAIYTCRYNLKTLVVGKSIGGTANLAGEVENYPGFVGGGAELMGAIREQAEKLGAEFLEEEVKSVDKRDEGFRVVVGDINIIGKSVIMALGTEHRQLNIPGEKEFLGKGVSYCATCDGNFFRGKNVAVIGGADSAAKAAIYLSDICEKVYVVYRKHEMRCEPISLSKIRGAGNIEIIYHSTPTGVIGSEKVEGLKIMTDDDGKSESVLDVDGVFIEVGAAPAIEIVKNLGLEMNGDYIVTDKGAKTNVDGVFAAGDVTNNFLKQIVTAAGEGAVAAKGVHEFLMG